MKNSKILAVYKATTVSSTMWACTYGINRWMPTKLVGDLTAKVVDCLTAELVDHLIIIIAKLVNHLTSMVVNHFTAKLMNLLTAKLMDHLTAKLMVVNIVKLHLRWLDPVFFWGGGTILLWSCLVPVSPPLLVS